MISRRGALWLYEVEGWSVLDIAYEFGVSPELVAMIITGHEARYDDC